MSARSSMTSGRSATTSPTGPKTVRYYLMAADAGGGALAKDVDLVRWVSIDEAVALVTYDRDREVLERARGLV